MELAEKLEIVQSEKVARKLGGGNRRPLLMKIGSDIFKCGQRTMLDPIVKTTFVLSVEDEGFETHSFWLHRDY